MSLVIHVDSNGYQRIDYYRLREELLAAGRSFTPETLRKVPYDQLALCAVASAGATVCPVELVTAEKQLRRERFLSMDEWELHACSRYLYCQGMFEDVRRIVGMRNAPEYDSLKAIQKAWLVLNCLNNHVDNPEDRMSEVVSLIVQSWTDGQLSAQLRSTFINGMMKARQDLSIVSDQWLHRFFATTAASLMEYMMNAERPVCTSEGIRGYHCTSDCYQFSLEAARA